MVAIQKINHGEILWDDKVNQNFDMLNQAFDKIGGVLS